MAKRTVGFLLQNSAGLFLSGKKHWFRERPVEGHVFTAAQVKRIQTEAHSWESVPVWAYPAYYEPQTGITCITGDRKQFVLSTLLIGSKNEVRRKKTTNTPRRRK